MATLKAIRRRIASVQSTQQVTRAMKLVSAAKLRRAQEALLNDRPYAESLSRLAGSLLSGQQMEAPPGAKPSALITVITSDRGLCGGYNANLLRHAEEQADEMRKEGLEPTFFAVGRKAVEHFKRAGTPLVGQQINNTPRLATMELASSIGEMMLTEFRAGQFQQTAVIYSQFRSALSQRPTHERILPVEAPGTQTADGVAGPTEYLIEPSRAELLPVIIQSYVESAVFHALLEAEASEHAARMTAMDSASNNAADMIDRLTLEMNRARQAGITRELMDIVGGAEALAG
ncbi:MAG TPA: ATP synthase F1 subunit gamma [Candidatus Binataceae bacterium]